MEEVCLEVCLVLVETLALAPSRYLRGLSKSYEAKAAQDLFVVIRLAVMQDLTDHKE